MQLNDKRYSIFEQKLFDTIIDGDDTDLKIRIIKYGYGLERLVGDNNPDVRAAVAKAGFALNYLAADTDVTVFKTAIQKIVDTKDIDFIIYCLYDIQYNRVNLRYMIDYIKETKLVTDDIIEEIRYIFGVNNNTLGIDNNL